MTHPAADVNEQFGGLVVLTHIILVCVKQFPFRDDDYEPNRRRLALQRPSCDDPP